MGNAPDSVTIGGLTVTSVIDGYCETNAPEFWNVVADATALSAITRHVDDYANRARLPRAA